MRPHLRDVTLVAVTSVARDQTLHALCASMRQVRFGKVLLLSDKPFPSISSGIDWRRIDPIHSRADYSCFMLRKLASYIETKHALCVQWDGYVLDGGMWNPQFLEYDYIGAPWPHFHDDHRVGNGGFSLRSRRLLEACADLPLDETCAEDVLIARVCRSLLEKNGMQFAPEAVARDFAYERMPPTGNEFGFHGAFNLVRLLTRARATKLFRDLEPNVLARSERWELFRWAVAHGRLSLARTLFRKLFRSRGTSLQRGGPNVGE